MLPEVHVATTFGLLLAISLLAGLAAEWIHVPKVTAYLLVGLLLGPSMLDGVPEAHVAVFDPFLKFAMGLVLFGLGCQFPLKHLRRIIWRVIPLSLGELIFTLVFVTVGLAVFGGSFSYALLLGTLALATAPATTVLVLREFDAEGPLTEYTGALVVLNNLAAIVAFEIAFLGIKLFSVASGAGEFSFPLLFGGLQLLVRDIFGALAVGALAGMVTSYSCGLLSRGRWLVLLVAVTTLLLGICESLAVPYMLTFLVMGVTVANTSDQTVDIRDELDHLTGLLCVLFFSVHGTEMDVAAFWQAGLIGVLYIVLRLAGKYAGAYVAASLMKESQEVRRWMGCTLFAQAGAAIGLATLAVSRDPQLGREVQIVILGSVIVFEILGPLMIRKAVLSAGEVPISRAVPHHTRSIVGQLRDLWDRMLIAGSETSPNEIDLPELTAKDFLAKNIQVVSQSADFDDVLSVVEESRDGTYPVVDNDGVMVGIIRYPLLSTAFFDPHVSTLVRAEDLATEPSLVLYPDDPVQRIQRAFQQVPDDCIPVVSRESPPKLLGLIRRRDFTHTLILQHRRGLSARLPRANRRRPETAARSSSTAAQKSLPSSSGGHRKD